LGRRCNGLPVRYLEGARSRLETWRCQGADRSLRDPFDLAIGRADVRPDAAMGYQACQNASADPPAEEMWCRLPSLRGAYPGHGASHEIGHGSASLDLGHGVVVWGYRGGHPLGDVVDPSNGVILAGTRAYKRGPIHIARSDLFFADTLAVMKTLLAATALELCGARPHCNPVVVATNASLNKNRSTKLPRWRRMAGACGASAHTMLEAIPYCPLDGAKKVDVNIVGALR